MRFKIKCPYCGFENLRILQTKAYYNKKIITCDEDEGGCGKDFVLDITVKYEQKTLKIEGEQFKEIQGKINMLRDKKTRGINKK